MGLTDLLNGSAVCIDTAPFIYFIEENPLYLDIVRPVFASIDAGKIRAVTSTVTMPCRLPQAYIPVRTDF